MQSTRRIKSLCMAVLLLASQAYSQVSLYERIFGLQNDHRPNRSDPGLRVLLTGDYHDVFRRSGNQEKIKIVRSGFGASMSWWPSETQGWHFALTRRAETFKVNESDSGFNFESHSITNRFRITYDRQIGHLPVRLLTFLQIYDNRKQPQWNYGLGIEANAGKYRFAVRGEQKSWLPFFQTLTSQNVYEVEIHFPSLAKLQQFRWSLGGNVLGASINASFNTGRLVSSNTSEREYTFNPSASVRDFTVSMTKGLDSVWLFTASFLFDRISGDGILRFRDRKYGNMHLDQIQFYETQLSLRYRRTHNAGVAYQKLMLQTNATVEAWPFDNSSVDFFGEKQSMSANGNLSIMRGWLKSTIAMSERFQMGLSGEYVFANPDAEFRTWGSALVFGTGNVEQESATKNHSFIKIGLAPTLNLSKNISTGLRLNQWILLGNFGGNAQSNSRGGTFAEVVLSYHR